MDMKLLKLFIMGRRLYRRGRFRRVCNSIIMGRGWGKIRWRIILGLSLSERKKMKNQSRKAMLFSKNFAIILLTHLHKTNLFLEECRNWKLSKAKKKSWRNKKSSKRPDKNTKMHRIQITKTNSLTFLSDKKWKNRRTLNLLSTDSSSRRSTNMSRWNLWTEIICLIFVHRSTHLTSTHLMTT